MTHVLKQSWADETRILRHLKSNCKKHLVKEYTISKICCNISVLKQEESDVIITNNKHDFTKLSELPFMTTAELLAGVNQV